MDAALITYSEPESIKIYKMEAVSSPSKRKAECRGEQFANKKKNREQRLWGQQTIMFTELRRNNLREMFISQE